MGRIVFWLNDRRNSQIDTYLKVNHQRTLADTDDIPKPTVFPSAFQNDFNLKQIAKSIV